jgi:hypothetical protein
MLGYSEVSVSSRVRRLRIIVQEGIRIQRGHSERVNYVDARMVKILVVPAAPRMNF